MDSKTLDEIFESLSKKYIFIGEKPKNATLDEIIDSIINYYENIINPMPAHIYWLDPTLRVAGCNQSVLYATGLKTLAELKGLSYEELAARGHWPDEVREAIRKDSLEVIRTGKPKLHIEDPPVSLPNGMVMYFLTSRVPIFDNQKKVVGVLGISVDITERKKAEVELKLAKEKAEVASYTKSEFIANMNHDIRTPLASMIGMSEIIIEESQEQHIKEYAQDVIKAGERLLEFVNNILEIMQTDLTTIQDQPVDLRKTMQSLAELFKPSFTKKHLDFQLKFDEEIPKILGGSGNLIYRIVLNLVGNAIKFTEKGGITITVKQTKVEGEKRYVAISITDTGIGIPEDKQQIIFESFTKLSASYQGRYKGNGLGLYTVKQLVDKLQGTIDVKSSLGKGSTFTVTLPLIANKKFETMAAAQPTTESHRFEISPALEMLKVKDENKLDTRNTHGIARILVVEDDDIAGKVAVLRLKKLNCQVDLAVTGEEALQKVYEKLYHLIYMDIGLPGKDGCTVTEEIRAWEKETGKSPVPIIALTAHIDEAGKERCLASGLNLVLKKPVSQLIMQQHLESYLPRISVAQENENGEGGDEVQAEIAAMFRKEIKDNISLINKHYKNKNWEDLQFLAHKFNGSASYCAPTQFKIAISELENALMSVQKQKNQVDKCFKGFITEANNFLEKSKATNS